MINYCEQSVWLSPPFLSCIWKAGSRVTLFWSLQPLENLDLTETLLVFLALEMLGITVTLAYADFEKACGYSDTFLASACWTNNDQL